MCADRGCAAEFGIRTFICGIDDRRCWNPQVNDMRNLENW
jgi:hypothetical protein